ncbi:hypothetical protein [Borreliella bavariensis]|uniref:hypothetical protein n=1 Tax=Borreliella bavariensis TaxID=664662 RepID=UPI00398A8F68
MMKTKNIVKTNASTAFAQKLAKDALAKEEEKIQKTLREILYERPDDSIVFRIAKNIYDKEFKVRFQNFRRIVRKFTWI